MKDNLTYYNRGVATVAIAIAIIALLSGIGKSHEAYTTSFVDVIGSIVFILAIFLLGWLCRGKS